MINILTKRTLSFATVTVCLFMVFSLLCNKRSIGETVSDNDISYINDSTKIDPNREEAEKLLSRFNKKRHIFRNANVYRDPRCPKYLSTNSVFIYLVEQKGEYKLRLKTQYSGQEWLITKMCRIITDDGQYVLMGEFERGTEGVRIWETLDVEITKDTEKILESIVRSKKVIIKYVGMKTFVQRAMTKKEISIIERTLFIYQNIR